MATDDVFDLSGRVAVVTGGSKGLGRAFCEAMAKHGADVVCVGRDKKALAETAAMVNGYGRVALPVVADMLDPQAIQRMADEAVDTFGKIDILIANAGITADVVPIHEMSIEEWDLVIDTNLKGQFLSMRAVLPTMLKQRSGSIISISSVGALGGSDVPPASYGASKAGVIALCKYAAVQYGKYGIRVNCILPGLHITNLGMPADQAGKAERVKFMEAIAADMYPLGRVGYPNEMEGLVVLLASDASSYITGATFIQDGGGEAKA